MPANNSPKPVHRRSQSDVAQLNKEGSTLDAIRRFDNVSGQRSYCSSILDMLVHYAIGSWELIMSRVR